MNTVAPGDGVTVIGGGLAGCEAALWLAGRGVRVTLYEQKPGRFSPAHKSPMLAELVCSNSLKAERLESAGGLLKAEMRRMGSRLLPAADGCRVAAGGALAVDRDACAAAVTAVAEAEPGITLVRRPAEGLGSLPGGPSEVVIVATGPLTEGPLADEIAAAAGGMLSFYDAAAPIVTADSLDMGRIFAASRYGRGGGDYLNCPMDKAGYEAFYAALIKAEGAPLHDFDELPAARNGPGAPLPAVFSPAELGAAPQNCGAILPGHPSPAAGASCFASPPSQPSATVPTYEGCMPLEVLARRGPETLRYGPMRPVGLTDPRTGHRPWACVQLRCENAEGTLYNLVGFQTNLRFGEQRRVFGMIPGLESAEFARYGVMHRNTFLNGPAALGADLSLKERPNIFFAGQITGFEGYMESAACGLLAARAALARLEGQPWAMPPAETMCGALARYVTAPNKDFQPMGANMGLLPPLDEAVKGKRQRYAALAERALKALEGWLAAWNG
jgi:methylenetetrahydrofolate--tRNA-(uracil-5-)-methyltransferase